MWYFLSVERKRNGKKIENYLEEESTPSIFAFIAKEPMISLIAESYVRIPYLSFKKDHPSFAEVLEAFKKSKVSELKRLITLNKFSYKEFFEIQDEFIKIRGNRTLKFDIVLSHLLILKNIKINQQKIKNFLTNYSIKVVGSQNCVLEDYETVSIKAIADSGNLKKILVHDIEDRTKYYYGSDKKLNKKILKEELEEECFTDYLGDIKDQFIFLPTMYYLDMIGDIKITDICPDHHYFQVAFYLEDKRLKQLETDKILSLNFTEKEDNIFYVYVNHKEEPVKLNYKFKYAKILYDVAKNGSHKVKDSLKKSVEEAVNNNINLRRKDSNPLYKKYPDLKSTKLLKIEKDKVLKESGVEINMK